MGRFPDRGQISGYDQKELNICLETTLKKRWPDFRIPRDCLRRSYPFSPQKITVPLHQLFLLSYLLGDKQICVQQKQQQHQKHA